jgi:hypothetical protein
MVVIQAFATILRIKLNLNKKLQSKQMLYEWQFFSRKEVLIEFDRKQLARYKLNCIS